MNSVEMLDRALEGETPDSAIVRALVDVARELSVSLTARRLSGADRERIHARSLALLEGAVHDNRRAWQRLLGASPSAPVMVGGAAAVTLGAAALAWALLHGRQTRRPLASSLVSSGAVRLA